MNLLKDISAFSSFYPEQGDMLKLFHLAINEEVSRTTAATYFQSKNHLNVVYKKLKDRLLDGILLNSFSDLSEFQRKHFQIRKRGLDGTMLLKSGKGKTAIKIMEDTLQLADKYGLIDVSLAISRDLEGYFSSVERDKMKWKKYNIKTRESLEYFIQECKAQSFFSELAHCIQYNMDTDYLLPRLEDLKNITKKNKQYKFRVFYYSSVNLFARNKNDQLTIIKTCREAIAFFKYSKTMLPTVIKWNFQYQMIPIYLTQKNYAKAEVVIKESLQYPKVGSYNWHLTLFYQAILGFYSNKPKITFKTWKKALSKKKKFDSEAIDSRWAIIQAYLHLFVDAGRIDPFGSFRLYRFINDAKPAAKGKHNLYILELLHLLIADKKSEYMRRVEGVESFIQSQKPINRRTRYFLRMLKAVEAGDYHPVRVTAHAKKNYDLLKKITTPIDVNVFDVEPVPYETLWELVLEKLQRKNK